MPERQPLDFRRFKAFLVDNMVTVMFVVICVLGWWLSGLTIPFVVNDLIGRLARNSLLVLALLIPVMAGMGLNFAITLGAMSAQFAAITVTHWKIGGVQGFIVAVVLSTPIAAFIGILTGKLLNRTRGQEMITSMITGYFANGVYMLILLVLVGTLIPLNNPDLLLGSGVGIKNTVDLALIRGSVDNIFKVSVPKAGLIMGCLLILINLWRLFRRKSVLMSADRTRLLVFAGGGLVLGLLSAFTLASGSLMKNVNVPVITFGIVALACLFNTFISQTKLGQDFRTVGQDQHVARVSGVNVEKTRIIAITISTVMAAWGQLMLLQNLGNLSTYDSHTAVGTFAIAALLIGGASVTKATVGQALVGLALFHTLFMVSPFAGKNLLGDAQLGEFFRSFVAYGIIAVSLVMHAWRRSMAIRKKLKE